MARTLPWHPASCGPCDHYEGARRGGRRERVESERKSEKAQGKRSVCANSEVDSGIDVTGPSRTDNSGGGLQPD